MTPERIAELRELCDAATEGPWANHGSSSIVRPGGDAELGTWLVASSFRWAVDKAFVTAAREALPAALDEIEQQAKVIDRLRHRLGSGEVDRMLGD